MVLPIWTRAKASSGKTPTLETKWWRERHTQLTPRPLQLQPCQLSLSRPAPWAVNPDMSFPPAHPSHHLPPLAHCTASSPTWLIANARQDVGSSHSRQRDSLSPRAACQWRGQNLLVVWGALRIGLGLRACSCFCAAAVGHGHSPAICPFPSVFLALMAPCDAPVPYSMASAAWQTPVATAAPLEGC